MVPAVTQAFRAPPLHVYIHVLKLIIGNRANFKPETLNHDLLCNEEHFQTNADVHSVNIRHKHYLHKPTANLSCFQMLESKFSSICYLISKVL
jgi:hypothetical protein